MLAFKDSLGNVVQRVPDDADLDAYDLTGLTVETAEFEDLLIPDLDAARARQRALINAARDAAQDGGAMTPSGAFDSNERSRQFLNGAVMTATLAQLNSQPFSIDWTLADNSVVTLSGAALIEAGVAVALHVDAIQRRARVLKERIDAAETLAEIVAIGWTLEDEV